MLKKITDFERYLQNLAESNCKITQKQLFAIWTQIGFFQHERIVHEGVMILFSILFVFGIFFFIVMPLISIFCLDLLFLIMLCAYIKHYFGLENGVQRLYELYNQLCSNLE